MKSFQAASAGSPTASSRGTSPVLAILSHTVLMTSATVRPAAWM